MKNYIKLMRIKHYLKNFLIFLPLVFSGQFFQIDKLINCFLSFISFSLVASTTYIINDIFDIESDKKHLLKKERPLASGAVTIKNAIMLSILLVVISINILIIANLQMGISYLLIYLTLNILYSYKLKDIPIVDLIILVSGFLIRTLYGGDISNINISNWLYLTVLSLSFYIGLGKRRNELKKNNDSTRFVLKYYTYEFLDKNMYMCLSLSIVFYSMWCVNKPDIVGLVWTVPLVIIICMRYSMIIEGNSFGDPVDVVFTDKILLILIFIYAIVIFALLYSNTLL